MMTKPPKKAFPCRRLFSVVAAGVVLALTPVAGALAAPSSPPGGKVAVATRPANVPADYIATPDGFFAPSCVYRLAANQLLMPDRGTEAIVTMSAAQRRLANPAAWAPPPPLYRRAWSTR
ncbi:UDP-N-acetylmuramoylalanyl-D-glutamate--2, 6-diaminopimelate ligase [Leifsonia xyli subsp. cynodontis DSM 46306]|jgi:hypothetical protein|uniref:Secreted protein n=1 Tax=Leifsonia xyli subsp. cynodontis DSM 46306 TaxID=1389489 RepID=U3PCW7_LEIXC|nr:hypothetical protein [Leifsonia xyli]AGW42617.1 UDP-N-acetylmuramoylalanyl-D-glutamate--2, 6-diaminopimelate ligase [Leifsonia xyli subsp. cynodontis DSM 46306]